MKIDNLGSLIENLKADLDKHKNKCIWRIQIDEGVNKEDPELKCLNCNGYSSRVNCIYFTDILHLIRFYEGFKQNDKDREGYYK